jgi:hypothetical protein
MLRSLVRRTSSQVDHSFKREESCILTVLADLSGDERLRVLDYEWVHSAKR